MAEKQRIGDLEIHQDLAFQNRIWQVQRLGWMVMVLVLVATILGLMGDSGILSDTVVGQTADPLQIEYERFNHLQAPTQLQAHINAVAGSEEVRLWIDRKYLKAIQIEGIVPNPDSVEAAANRLIYVFKVADPAQSIDITFNLKPNQFGLLRGEVGLPGERPLRFSQFVYP